MTINDQIQQEWDNFQDNSVEVIDGYYFSQSENIKRITLYINDKFLGDVEDNAIFWNLSTPRIPHFAKNIDLDTKDLETYGVGDVNFFQNWVLKMKFSKWVKDNEFALTLNDLSEGISTYGSIIWKKIMNKGIADIEEAQLKNMAFDPTVKNLKDSNFIIEKHLLTEMQLKAKDGIWEHVQDVIDTDEKVSNTEDNNTVKSGGEDIYFELFERYGEFEDEDGKIEYKHFITSGVGDKGYILFEEKSSKEKQPYYDFHLGRYRGRWQRVGVVERLYKLQERMNTLVNENAQTTEIASILLLRSADPSLKGNILTNTESGDIISSTDLQQVPMDNRFINGFITELQQIERQSDKLCNTPDIIQGETMPSGTPFRGLAVMSNAAKSTFRFYKESIGEKIGYILIDDILPTFIKGWNKEEILEIGGDEQDIEEYNKLILKESTRSATFAGLMTGELAGQMATINPEEVLEKAEKNGRKIKHGKDFFNFDYGIRINPTGESVDKAQQNDAYNVSIKAVIENPPILNLPLMRQYLENNGIRWTKLKPDEMQQLMAGQNSGKEMGAIGGTPDKLMSQVDSE